MVYFASYTKYIANIWQNDENKFGEEMSVDEINFCYEESKPNIPN